MTYCAYCVFFSSLAHTGHSALRSRAIVHIVLAAVLWPTLCGYLCNHWVLRFSLFLQIFFVGFLLSGPLARFRWGHSRASRPKATATQRDVPHFFLRRTLCLLGCLSGVASIGFFPLFFFCVSVLYLSFFRNQRKSVAQMLDHFLWLFFCFWRFLVVCLFSLPREPTKIFSYR